jgi:RNA polymerase sigma-70 factor (ECF subfamily)
MLRARALPALNKVEPKGTLGSPSATLRAVRQPLRFLDVYDDCFELVWRTVRRLGIPSAGAEDAVQEVFFTVHRWLGDFQGRSSVNTWVFAIVLHVVRHYRRSWRRKDLPHATAPDTPIDELPDRRGKNPLQATEIRDKLRLVDDLLRALDDDKREVFVLAHLEQMTAPEIAEILEENVNTVYSRLRAAREEFEQALERHCAHEAWRER